MEMPTKAALGRGVGPPLPPLFPLAAENSSKTGNFCPPNRASQTQSNPVAPKKQV
jgi:hypothetical protein